MKLKTNTQEDAFQAFADLEIELHGDGMNYTGTTPEGQHIDLHIIGQNPIDPNSADPENPDVFIGFHFDVACAVPIELPEYVTVCTPENPIHKFAS